MSARSQWALLEFAVEVRRDPCVILHRSLSEDLLEILVESS